MTAFSVAGHLEEQLCLGDTKESSSGNNFHVSKHIMQTKRAGPHNYDACSTIIYWGRWDGAVSASVTSLLEIPDGHSSSMLWMTLVKVHIIESDNLTSSSTWVSYRLWLKSRYALYTLHHIGNLIGPSNHATIRLTPWCRRAYVGVCHVPLCLVTCAFFVHLKQTIEHFDA